MSREDKGSYPADDLPISQFVDAAKKRFREIIAGGSIATAVNEAEVNLLEQDMSEILSLLRTIKNAFSPINRIPLEVLSLLPNYWKRQDYWDCQDADRNLISLTHVCRGWRTIFTSHPSLWTRLDCKNVDKTRVYIKRSRSLPLEIALMKSRRISYHKNALLKAIPHISRLSSLFIYGSPQGFRRLLDYFPFPAPLLEELKIIVSENFSSEVTIPNVTLSEDLSPLHKLSLSGVITNLPWKNLSNLTEFRFCRPSGPVSSPSVAQLLDFFESAPLLRIIILRHLIPDHFSVSPNRLVPLPNLRMLDVNELPAHSTFFDHLSIPTGASLDLRFDFSAYSPRIPVCLTNNFGNLYHITKINLLLNTPCWAGMQLSGPSGELCMSGHRADKSSSIIQSLCKFDLSKTQVLSVMVFGYRLDDRVEEPPIPQLLPLMNDLRTLTLARVDRRPFIHALNPKKNDSRTILYPQLEKLILYSEIWDRGHIKELVEMASERAKNRSKLSSITIVGLDGCYPREEVSSLKKFVSHVEYRSERSLPKWYTVFGDTGYDDGWNAFPSGYGGDDDDDEEGEAEDDDDDDDDDDSSVGGSE